MIGARTAMRWIAVALALFVAMGDVRAQVDATDEEKKRANQLIGQANRDKKAGDRYAKRKRTEKRAMAAYRKAVLGYMEAHSLIEHPLLVLKLADAYRARGEKRWALRGYKRYLTVGAEGRKKDEARVAIEALSVEIAEDEAEGIAPPEDESSELEPTAVFGLEGQEEEPAPEAEPDDDDDDDDDDDGKKAKAKKKKKGPEKKRPPGQLMRYGGIGTASAGALFLVIGMKYGLDARSASSDLSNNDDGWSAEDRALIDSGKSANKKFLVFSLLGAAAIAGGGVMYYYGNKKEKRARADRPRMVWTPEITPKGATLTVMGRF